MLRREKDGEKDNKREKEREGKTERMKRGKIDEKIGDKHRTKKMEGRRETDEIVKEI